MKTGVIGGSGFYEMEGLEQVETVAVDTPFGAPSDELVHGRVAGREVYFLPRHGRGHRLLPSEINHRANICAMKQLGVDHILSISAVGSLREHLRPRDLVLPDQYFDRTKQSAAHTFFGDGLVAHVAFGEPACPVLRAVIAERARIVIDAIQPPSDVRINSGGTYACMEGPAFSTRAESNINRQLGCDVIGMTSLPEAKLCREAEICYQAIAMVTDYDCWHETEEAVSVELILGHLAANSKLALSILRELIPAIPAHRECGCRSALACAIATDLKVVPAATRQKLAPLMGKYLGA
jgi:5'-methylthioadenosine phosphorylase